MDVYLYGALRHRFSAAAGFLPLHLEVAVGPDGTIRDVLASLAIAPDEVVHLFLNGQYSAAGRRVKPGDRLGIFGRDMALLYRQYFPKVADPA
ncbi:MAG TPA: hypothetical protein VEW91_01005 [bacterium]|nr:hypothetical protein [bacterium]